MVNYREVEEGTGFFEFLCKSDVGFAGFDVSAGMVMAEDHGRGILLQCHLEDLFWVGDGAGEPALADAYAVDDLVAPVEEHDPEFFVGRIM